MDNNFVATGRAKCQACGKKITKGVICVKAYTYQSEGQCHKVCDPVLEFLTEQGGK